ncbi:glycosyltransferase family 32 protein [Arcticibacterium luteifluviistationis]|nr:glycosyltransferase [Arcticibacterium luteifluviistationis]
MKQAKDSWLINHDFSYQFFNDTECLEFIRSNFSKEEAIAFMDLIPGAFKADLFRLCVLYIHGGVYADVDTICLSKIQSLLSDNVNFIVCRDDPMAKKWLWNGFIASTPQHPILKLAISKILSNVKTKDNKFYLDYTGPALLGKTVNQYLGQDIEKDFELGFEGKTNILVLEHNNGHISHQGKQIIKCEYPTKNTDNLPSYFWDNVEKNRIYRQIPRQVFYTALDVFDVNDYMTESFKQHNPEYEIKFFNQYSVDKWFINTGYNQFYKTLTNRGEISDFFRYCYLYENGGVYVDTDTFCNQPLDNWITYQDIIFGLEGNVVKEGFFKDDFFGIGYQIDNKLLSVCNWAIACKKHHPLMKQIIEDIMENPSNKGVLVNTGPGRITAHVIDYFGKDKDYTKDVTKDNSTCLSINGFGSNQGHSDAKKYDNPFSITDKDIYITHMFEGTWRGTKTKHDIILLPKEPHPSVSHNLTLYKVTEGYKGISRYDINQERTIFMEKIGEVKTVKAYSLTDDFKLIDSEIFPISGYLDLAKFEDYRAFNYKSKLYYSVAYVDKDWNTYMSVLDEHYNFLGDVIIDQYNKTAFVAGKEVFFEKNWLFFERDNELYFIYSTTPHLVIYKCQDFDNLIFKKHTTQNIDNKHSIPRNEMYHTKKVSTGGSTNPILIDGYYYYLIHTKIYAERAYNHWLVKLTQDLEFVSISEIPFVSKNIGFALFFIMSMIESGDELILSGGVEDNQNFIWKIPKKHLEKFS